MTTINILRSERFRRLFKESFWIVLGQVLAVIGSLVGVRLLTGLLNPTTYGELALGMTLVTLVSQTVLGPLGNGVTRFYAPAAEQSDLGGYLNAVRRLVLLATGIIVLMIPVIVAGLLVTGRSEWIAIAIAALVFAILSGYNSILSGIQSAARQRAIAALHQGIEPWARFLVAAGLLLWLGATSTVAMLGYVIGLSVVLGSQYMFFQKSISKNIKLSGDEKRWRKNIWKYSLPFATWGVLSWGQLSSDRWALEYFGTAQEVGLYSVLFQLGYYPISMITGMTVQFIEPILFQRAGDTSDSRRITDVHKLSWRLTWLALGITFFAFVFGLLFHALIFRIFVARRYLPISYLLPWMLLSGGIFAASHTVAINLTVKIKTHTMIPAKIITALLGMILNFFGAYLAGITGVVISSILFSSTYFLWMVMLSKKISG